MCGIVAQLHPVRYDAFNRAMELTAHRGFRSAAEENRGGRIGHVRLPIVGLDARNDQPVTRHAFGGNWVLAFVGEVLDFREHYPRMECDLEIVTRAWMRRGPGGLKNHDGFWSIAAVSDQGELHVVCDYLAQKPMYYRQDACAAASELDAAAAFGPVTPDEVYFSSVVKWGYCPDVTRTPYAEVKHVLPGEHAVIRRDGCVSRSIVDPLVPCRRPSPVDLKQEIEDAVRRRVLSSDVPAAALVSGGLDSSVVYSLAKRYGSLEPYYAFEPTAAGKPSDVEEALAVGAVTGVSPVTPVPWSNVTLSEALSIMQEPVDLGSLVPQVALSRAIRERVCLTGDGADEVFGGYGRSERYDSQWSDLFQELPAWHLPRLDRVMMRHCVEVRTPFLARRVVEMAMGLPHSARQDKLMLRNLFKDDLPADLAWRKKKPLRTPEVEQNREAVSKVMVEAFRRDKWPEERSDDNLIYMVNRRAG
jgi:asparagine synthase (glutamine-hydrolysing)